MKPQLTFTPLELNKWPRGEIFYYFSKMAPTGYSLTVEVDITHFKQVLKQRGYKFFAAYLWLVTKLLSQQQEFMIAQKGDTIGHYNYLTPLYAAFHDDDKTFSLMWTDWDDDFLRFHNAYLSDKQTYGSNKGVLSKKDALPPENAYTISCVPWISFSHFAVHSQNASYYLPSVEAGRYFNRGDRLIMPLSLTCHHATTDGYHINLFLQSLQQELDSFERYL